MTSQSFQKKAGDAGAEQKSAAGRHAVQLLYQWLGSISVDDVEGAMVLKKSWRNNGNGDLGIKVNGLD